jgi:hypothetical protein
MAWFVKLKCVLDLYVQYAGPNPVAFDIANHWCEWAADYHTDTPHLLDYTLMPDAQEQVAYVRPCKPCPTVLLPAFFHIMEAFY